MHKTNGMQSIEQISTWEVFSSICPLFERKLYTLVCVFMKHITVLDRKTLEGERGCLFGLCVMVKGYIVNLSIWLYKGPIRY